jgi:hypothetical protein
MHLRKSLQGAGKDDSLDSFRGAGHLVGAAHRAWRLEPISNDNPAFLLHDVKARRGTKLPSVRIEVVDDAEGENVRTTVEVVGTVGRVENGYDRFMADVLVFIDATPLREARTKDLQSLPDAPPPRTVNDYLKTGVTSKVLKRPKQGVYRRGGSQLPTSDDQRGDAQ